MVGVKGALSTVDKQLQKYHLDKGTFLIAKYPDVDGYTITVPALYKYYDNDTEQTFKFKVPYVFSPTMTLEDAKRKVKEITNIRIYDRFYAINKSIQDELEAQELHAASGHNNRHLFLTPKESNFYNTLPAWVQRFVKELYIDNPGQNPGSYQLVTHPLPGDTNKDDVEFYGYDAAMIREELKRYKADFSRVGVAYNLEDI